MSEELCITTWQLFETLLVKQHAHVINNLVLRNLIGRDYAAVSSSDAAALDSTLSDENISRTQDNLPSKLQSSTVQSTTTKADPLSKNTDVLQSDGAHNSIHDETFTNKSDISGQKSDRNNVSPDGANGEKPELGPASEHHEHTAIQSDCVPVSVPPVSTTNNLVSILPESSNVLTSSPSDDLSEMMDMLESMPTPSDACEVSLEDLANSFRCELSGDVLGINDGEIDLRDSMAGWASGRGEDEKSIHWIVNTFLSYVPEEAKSMHVTVDGAHESYLRDAHQQFSQMSKWCSEQGWPDHPSSHQDLKDHLSPSDVENVDTPFFEGTFLSILLDKLSAMLRQSYEINLQVTSVASRLAFFTHPNLHEFLLSPSLQLKPGCRSLPTVLHKVCADLCSKIKSVPDFQRRLLTVRRKLVGNSSSIRSAEEDTKMFAGVIVLEEFCKELAAIAFVKHHTQVSAKSKVTL